MSGLKAAFLHLFFPERCLFCGTVIERGRIFCADCEQDDHQPYFPKCCAHCRKDLRDCTCELKSAAVYYYEEGAEKAIKRMKFQGDRLCAEQLAKMMAKRFRELGPEYPDVIVPVPLHWRDRILRGFSQTVWLAKALSKELGVPYETSVLVKRRHTKKQHDLTQRERKQNLRGAFFCQDAEKISGKRILLIDDVTTTGATLLEVKQALQKAGVEEILCFTAAKTQFTESV